MELSAAIRRRRMVRAFASAPVDQGLLLSLLDHARRAPSAGNTQAVEFLVLTDPDARARYWDVTLPEQRRTSFRWQGLLDAPVLVIVTVRPDAYVDRYAEQDKARPGLGERLDAWPVPFWWVDAGAVVQNMLLLAVDAGLAACLFGLFDNEAAVSSAFGVPDDVRAVAAITIGHPLPDEPGRSSGRERPTIDTIVHWEDWS